MGDVLPDQTATPVPVWTIHPGTMGRGWPARVTGPLHAIDPEVAPVIVLWDIYRATCDGIPLPFGTWMMQDGPSQVVAEVQELREAFDTVSESETALLAEGHRLRAELDSAKALRAEVEALKAALREIEDLTCECTGYYTCNGCEKRGPALASEALGALASDETEAS